MDGLVDHQALHLVEHGGVGGVGVAAIGAAGHHHADRRLLAGGDPGWDLFVDLAHHPHLHRAGVGAQHLSLTGLVGGHEEGVVHLPRRMFGREVQGGEVVEVGLDVRPLGHREAHLGEDGDHLIHHLHGGMHAAPAPRRGGQGQVDALGGQAPVELGGFHLRLALGQPAGHGVAQAVDQRALLAAFLRAHLAERFQQLGDLAALAEGCDADRLQGGGVGRGLHLGDQVGLQGVQIGHGLGALSRGRIGGKGAQQKALRR